MTGGKGVFMKKGILLFSGGLDSFIAHHVLKEQGVDLIPVRFSSAFFNPSVKNFPKNAEVKEIALGDDYLEIIKHPQHGYGKNLNPCIDCKMFLLKKAKELMPQLDVGFIVTGEVIGQRPKSQKKHIFNLMENETDLKGLILRPLSAKLMKETIPEENGWVDRSKLLDIQGRSRRKQLELAKEFGIDNYFTPAGGCLLTEKMYCEKLKDLMQHKEDMTMLDCSYLKIGRHIRLSDKYKIVVARNKEESERIMEMKKDLFILKTKGFNHPAAFIPDFLNNMDQGDGVLTEAINIFSNYAYKVSKLSEITIELFDKGGLLQQKVIDLQGKRL